MGFFIDELSICSVLSVDLCLLHSAQVPPVVLECVLCFPWTQPRLKAFLICVALTCLLSICLSRDPSLPWSVSREPPRKAHVRFWRSRRAHRGSASPLAPRPHERLLPAFLAHTHHTSGTSAARPAMLPDSSLPASITPTGIYEGLLCGGYLEARGQQWWNTLNLGWPHTKAWTFPSLPDPSWPRTIF